MSYIGVQPTAGQYRKLDNIASSFNGATTTFTTSVGGINVTAGTPQQLLVSVGGVIQQPVTDYTTSTNSITFSTAPAAGLDFFAVLMGDAINIGTPSDGSVTTSKLASDLTVDLASGSAAAPSLTFDANTGVFSPGEDLVAISTAGSERARIDSSGRLLVGTSTTISDAGIQVAATTGDASSISAARFGAGANPTYLSLYKSRGATIGSHGVVNNGDALGALYCWGSDGTNYLRAAAIQGEVDGTPGANNMPGRISFLTTPSGSATLVERMRITSTGQVRLAGAGITFNGDTATANELDDYEEGTFTPTISGSTAAGTATYTTQVGSYTKIGRIVQVQVNMTYSGHTGTGNMRIAGLPFTSQNRTGDVAYATVYYNSLTLPASAVATVADVSQNSTLITLRYVLAGGGASGDVAMDAAATIAATVVYTV